MEPIRAPRFNEPSAEEESGRLLEQAFLGCQDELYGLLYYLVGSAEDARDALQETFVKCWRRRKSIGEVENLRAWIFRVALNAGRDLRGTAWNRRRRPLDGEEGALPSKDQPPETDASRREEVARIHQALAQLRPQEQEIFLLRENGQMTYEEIALSINVPVGTVKTRMRLALRKLREVLEVKPE